MKPTPHMLMTTIGDEPQAIADLAAAQGVTKSVLLRRALRYYSALLGTPIPCPDLKRQGVNAGYRPPGWTHTPEARQKMRARALDRIARKRAA